MPCLADPIAIARIVGQLGDVVPFNGEPESGITVESVSGKLEGTGADAKWVETVVVKNSKATERVDWLVTSQPYKGLKYQHGQNDDGTPKAGENVAVRQSKKITIPAQGTVTVKFEFTGAEAKKWMSYYNDIYDKMPFILDNKQTPGNIGNYAAASIPAGPGGVYEAGFLFPYPNALTLSLFGPADFSLVITDTVLPPGWSFLQLGPPSFVLDYAESQLITARFQTSSQVKAGEIASVSFLLNPESAPGPDPRYRSTLSVKAVPEPGMMILLSLGVLSLVSYNRRTTADHRTR
jgi:hypothetical protein